MIKRIHINLGLISAVALITGGLLVSSAFSVGPEKAMPDADLALRKKEAALMVHVVAVGLGGQCEGTADAAKRIDLIRAFIDPIRFYPDGSGYFYVYDFNCVNIAHATQKDLLGKDLSGYQDVKGNFVIRELAKAARRGGGFVKYYWLKPGATGEHRKIGYVEPIPGTDYFIGTGVYKEITSQ